jgi:hypothetical protein
MNLRFLALSAAASLTMLAGLACGKTINWYSPIPKSNLTSTGDKMDSTVQFQLGVFANGFVPTPDNISQWSANWSCAQTASYNPGTKVFDGIMSVASNTGAFAKGAKAYIWQRSTSATKDEWMLYRASDWTWPAPNAMDPLALVWNTANANEIVMGAINPAGNPFLMKSGQIVSYSQWQNSQAALGAKNGPNDDPDHDGVPNLLEYAFGTAPDVAGGNPAMPMSLKEVAGQKFLEISIPRLRNRLMSTTVEVSDDLKTWKSGATTTAVVSSTDSTLVVRDLTPIGSGTPRRFMRLKADTAQ